MTIPAPIQPLRLAMTVEQCWQSIPGGSGRYIVELTKALAARGDVSGIGIAAFHGFGHGTQPQGEMPSFPIRQLALPRAALYEAWSRVRRPIAARPREVDVLHASTWAIPPRSAPLVVTVHDVAFLRSPEHFTARGNAFFRRSLETVRHEADAIIVPSKYTFNDCVQAGIDPARLHTIHLGVKSEPRTARDIADFRARYQLDREYILWCGTLEPRKNLPGLLRAFDQIASRRPDVDLVLVGPSGWGDVSGTIDIPTSISTDRVHILGRLADPDLQTAYAGARTFCFPSHWEGFGLPVIEAMAHGVPVVGSANTSIAEVGGDAILTAAAEDPESIAAQLEVALGDRHKELSAASLVRASEFTWDRCAARHFDVYQSLI